MTEALTIGEFSRLTHLTVKALRHYHDVGLLEPAGVDSSSGYRLYDTSQVATAQLVKRLRELDMPLTEVRTVLAAPDIAARDAAITAHLERMEQQLQRTREVVASLRALLTPSEPGRIALRHVPETRALSISERVMRDHIAEWCAAAYPQLYDAADRTGATVTGPAGGLYGPEFFESGTGAVTAYLPVEGGYADGSVEVSVLPAADLAVLDHRGPFRDLDITYGVLGTWAAQQGIGTNGAIREVYLAGPGDVDDESGYQTEVGWPVHQAELPPTDEGDET